MSNVLSLVREVIAMNIGDHHKTMAIRLITSYEDKAEEVIVLTRALNGAYENEKAQAEMDFLVLLEQEMAWEQFDDESLTPEETAEEARWNALTPEEQEEAARNPYEDVEV